MKVIHTTLTTALNESRMMREICAIREAFPQTKVLILALHEEELPEREESTDQVVLRRLRLKTRNWGRSLPIQLVKLVELTLRVLMSARRFAPDVIHSHSLGTLPSSVLVKLVTGARLIYDAHELETERNGETGIRQKLAKISEKTLMPFVDEVLVVSDSIADWYKHTYKEKRISVLYNAPLAHSSPQTNSRDLRAEIGASADDVLFLYLGVFGPGREIPLLMEVFRSLPANRRLVLIGYGPLVDAISETAKSCANIARLPAVPSNSVVSIASSADVGICLLDTDALSYRYALPNKLFEYRAAGLPAIVNVDCPEMARFVSTASSGWLVPRSAEALRVLIASIDAAAVKAKKKELHTRGSAPTWEQEAPKLTAAYTRQTRF